MTINIKTSPNFICSPMSLNFEEGLHMECEMDHIVLNVEDDEKMITFYSKVLMLAPERLEEYNAGDVPFPSVRLNSDTITDNALFSLT